MKKSFKILAVLTIVIGVSSCGNNEVIEKKEKTIEEKIAENPLAALQQATAEMEKVAESLNNGEAGEPIHYTDLQKFLPKQIEGYEREDPEGTTLSMGGFSVSSADVEYTSETGSFVRVTILDYFAAASMYQMATAMWGSGLKIDSDDEYAQGFSISDGVNGWETFDKKNNKASVVAGVGDRILITVEANNQDNVDMVKSVLTSINLKSLKLALNK